MSNTTDFPEPKRCTCWGGPCDTGENDGGGCGYSHKAWELYDAWERVYRAHEPLSDFMREWLKLAREGHPNRIAMLRKDLSEATGCALDYDGPCVNEGEPCEGRRPKRQEGVDYDEALAAAAARCPYDTPERAERRAALRALLALLGGAS